MKKINVRSILDPLSNQEMKNVTGGNDPYESGLDGDGGGTCCAVSLSGTLLCWVSKKDAIFWQEGGGHWCCDSCASATWIGNCY